MRKYPTIKTDDLIYFEDAGRCIHFKLNQGVFATADLATGGEARGYILPKKFNKLMETLKTLPWDLRAEYFYSQATIDDDIKFYDSEMYPLIDAIDCAGALNYQVYTLTTNSLKLAGSWAGDNKTNPARSEYRFIKIAPDGIWATDSHRLMHVKGETDAPGDRFMSPVFYTALDKDRYVSVFEVPGGPTIAKYIHGGDQFEGDFEMFAVLPEEIPYYPNLKAVMKTNAPHYGPEMIMPDNFIREVPAYTKTAKNTYKTVYLANDGIHTSGLTFPSTWVPPFEFGINAKVLTDLIKLGVKKLRGIDGESPIFAETNTFECLVMPAIRSSLEK